MIIICEECGKKYQIDPSRIKTAGAKAKCKACGNMMTIPKPETKPVEPPPALRPTREIPAKGEEPPSTGKEEKPEVKEAVPKAKKKGMGLRSKIFILFFLVPIILFVGAGYLYLWQLDGLARFITQESTQVVTQMAEQAIAENARSVAAQAKLYLIANPGLKGEDLRNRPEFSKVGVQPVGKTGYTAFYERPDAQGIWRTWAHTNEKIIGINMHDLEKPMGQNFPGFWKIFSGVKEGKEAKGYYTWLEKDGSMRQKYMLCTPVDGTPFVIASTTYLDEFTSPMKKLETRTFELAAETRNLSYMILGCTLLLIGIIVALYGTRLTSRIKKLTSVAEQISVGEMDAEIPVTSRDEIGDLAEAIRRMQESIRLSIERLRRRR